MVKNKLGANTIVLNEDGTIKVKLYDTNILQFDELTVRLNSDGFKTKTTKDRINKASELYHLGLKVFQKSNEWLIDYQGDIIPFSDGITLDRLSHSIINDSRLAIANN